MCNVLFGSDPEINYFQLFSPHAPGPFRVNYVSFFSQRAVITVFFNYKKSNKNTKQTFDQE